MKILIYNKIAFFFFATIAIPIGISLLSSCEEFTQISPPKTQIITETIYTDDAIALSAIRGIYSEMSQNTFITGGISLHCGWSADELSIYTTDNSQTEFYNNSLTPTNSKVGSFWTLGYQYIYYANAVLEGLEKSKEVTSDTKRQLIGEAKFIRAFCHFTLANLFGDIPIVTTTDYRINSMIPRAPAVEVYSQIIKDLIDAKDLLSEEYITTERVRPNKWCAIALLSRVYLYSNEWGKSESYATMVIDNSFTYDLVDDLAKVFLKNSKEAIWQLIPVRPPSFHTNDGAAFILSAGKVPTQATLSSQLLNIFEVGDIRRNKWVGSTTAGAQTYYFAYKYKVGVGSVNSTEYNMVLRLAEQYLIRAEARARRNDIPAAVADLNVIRSRAGLDNLSNLLDQDQMLTAIEQERRVELFTEGQRWFDLKRTSRINTVLSVIKSGWQPTAALYPIPEVQILNDPSMANQQNPGY